MSRFHPEPSEGPSPSAFGRALAAWMRAVSGENSSRWDVNLSMTYIARR